MSKKRFGKFAVLTLAAVMSTTLLLSGCSSSDDKKTDTPAPAKSADAPKTDAPAAKQKVDGGEIVTAYLAEPQGFIRFWGTSTTSSEATELVFSYLYKFGPQQDIVPDLAVGQPVFSDDKLTMTVKIRTDAKWTDGQPVTADDVVFTFMIPKNPDYKGPRGSAFTSMDKIEKVDDSTVKFTFKEPNAGFIDMMPYNILPQHLLKDVPVKDMDKSEFYKKPVGSGPYKLVEWQKGQYLRYERNENYYGGKPAVAKITTKIVPDANAMMAQLQAGEINFIGIPADQLEAIDAWVKQNPDKIKLQKGIKASNYSVIAWNLKEPLFSDKKVRQALTTAIDRKAIIDNVVAGQGVVVNSQTPPAYWTFTDNVPKFDYNPEKAKQMLAEAGWKDTDGDGVLDKDGKKFEFEFQGVQGNKVREKAMTVIQQQFKKLGIVANMKLYEGNVWSQNYQSKKFQAIYFAWNISGDPNPKSLWHSSEIEQGLNASSYSNQEVDKLIDEDLKTFDKEKRKQLLGKVDQLIAEDQPNTFLYSSTVTLAYPANLEGYDKNRDALKDVEKWYFVK